MDELDKRVGGFQELAERVNQIMGIYAQSGIELILKHLSLMNSSLDEVTATIKVIQDHTQPLGKAITNARVEKLIVEFQSVFQIGSQAMSIRAYNVESATGFFHDVIIPIETKPDLGGSQVSEQHKLLIQLNKNIRRSWNELGQKHLSYKRLNNSLSGYLDEHGIDDVSKVWSDLQEIKTHIEELIKLSKSLAESYRLWIQGLSASDLTAI